MTVESRQRPFTLALCNEVIRELPFDAQCRAAASLGYDALEVAPFTLADDPRTLRDSDLERLAGAAASAGVRVSSLHWLLMAPTGLSITSPDPQVRRTTLEVMEVLVGVCSALGGSVLVHGSPQQRSLSAEDPAGDVERAIEAFAHVATVARDAGVTYCIEPLSPRETAFVNTVAEATAIVDRIGEPALKTMLDARAARLSEPGPLEDVLRDGLRTGAVAHVHLNDSSSLAPGQGSDPFTGLVEVLLDEGYAGTVAVEPFDYRPDGPGAAAWSAGYVTGLLEALTVGPSRRIGA